MTCYVVHIAIGQCNLFSGSMVIVLYGGQKQLIDFMSWRILINTTKPTAWEEQQEHYRTRGMVERTVSSERSTKKQTEPHVDFFFVSFPIVCNRRLLPFSPWLLFLTGTSHCSLSSSSSSNSTAYTAVIAYLSVMSPDTLDGKMLHPQILDVCYEMRVLPRQTNYPQQRRARLRAVHLRLVYPPTLPKTLFPPRAMSAR